MVRFAVALRVFVLPVMSGPLNDMDTRVLIFLGQIGSLWCTDT